MVSETKKEKALKRSYNMLYFILWVVLILLLITTIVYKREINNLKEESYYLCEIVNNQREMVNTLSPYFVEESCSVSEELCEEANNINFDILETKLDCSPYT